MIKPLTSRWVKKCSLPWTYISCISCVIIFFIFCREDKLTQCQSLVLLFFHFFQERLINTMSSLVRLFSAATPLMRSQGVAANSVMSRYCSSVTTQASTQPQSSEEMKLSDAAVARLKVKMFVSLKNCMSACLDLFNVLKNHMTSNILICNFNEQYIFSPKTI